MPAVRPAAYFAEDVYAIEVDVFNPTTGKTDRLYYATRAFTEPLDLTVAAIAVFPLALALRLLTGVATIEVLPLALALALDDVVASIDVTPRCLGLARQGASSFRSGGGQLRALATVSGGGEGGGSVSSTASFTAGPPALAGEATISDGEDVDVCNSSLGSPRTWGEDWCAYLLTADMVAAYRGGDEYWTDGDGNDRIGLYDLASKLDVYLDTYDGEVITRMLAYNGGSAALEVNFPNADAGFNLVSSIYGYHYLEEIGVPAKPPRRATCTARVWIGPETVFVDASTSYISPVSLIFGTVAGSGVGECFVVMCRQNPFNSSVSFAVPHLWLCIQNSSSGGSDATAVDMGDASSLIGAAPGFEFYLELDMGEDSTATQLTARASVTSLSGGSSTLYEATVVNELNESVQKAYVQAVEWMDTRSTSTSNPMHWRCYSIEWYEDPTSAPP